MESCDTGNKSPKVAENDNVKEADSAENFQKFIYELFEKNGVLNDLRAYLRGQIVNVLKSAQTDDPPICQKHFIQRLDLTFQALNILIAEYLLCLEFNYSFSVFVSEIPLANMVFGFAKTLMKTSDGDNIDQRFKDADVWSILSYLGIQCDSVHASNIVEMYKKDIHTPLLLCILKCMPMYRKEPIVIDQVNSSDDSMSSSAKSLETLEDKNTKNSYRNTFHDKCKHYVFCKKCQSKMIRIKEKYRKKKKNFIKNVKETNMNSLTVESLMKNIGVIEKCLVDEMFQQLKTVYEGEVEMIKAEEAKKMKRSVATHALQLQRQQEETEVSFKAREEELERNVQQKKKFLWGLARALREQHEHMTRAMHDVRVETDRLTAKEDSLKTQLEEAEQILKQHGEAMRTQISSELVILEGHLESMKKERDSINKERAELEHLKTLRDSTSKVIKVNNMENDDLRSHYDLLKNELSILKKYLETARLGPKCVMETGTITELSDVTSKLNVILNNGQDGEGYARCDDVNPDQVVNDLKKLKNVNFSQSNLDELYRERARDRSRSSASSEAGDALLVDNDLVQRLKEENERLKIFARQQREHIDELSSRQARLHAELAAARLRRDGDATATWRPRTAPTVMPRSNYFVQGMNTSTSANNFNFGCRKGAGEQLSFFSNAQPRILLPGDTLPFIGVLRDRHTDNRRHLINQWRSLRRRISPIGGVSKPRTPSPAHKDRGIRLGATGPNISAPSTLIQDQSSSQQPPENNVFLPFRANTQQQPKTPETYKSREKSPKSVLREAKENLRNNTIKDHPPAPREKSPNSVLREAKLRLRKLEIEAEAVEQSYLDFRKRQSQLRVERQNYYPGVDLAAKDDILDLDVKRSRSLHIQDETYESEMNALYRKAQNSIKNDFEKYLKEYQNKYDLGESHFKNRNTIAEKIKPIPKVYNKMNEDEMKERQAENYLETPLMEFRKFYHSERKAYRPDGNLKSLPRPITKIEKNNSTNSESRRDTLNKVEDNKTAELEILKQNIGKIYNLEESVINSTFNAEERTKNEIESKNLLTVEVESVKETNDIKVAESQNVLLVVQSSVDNSNVVLSKSDENRNLISTQMTIIVSPKRNNQDNSNGSEDREKTDRSKRSVSPEQAANLTRNDVLDAIYHADTNNQNSSVQMQLESSKDILEESSDKETGEDYRDDFSADVDNYNSRSDYENNSPISLPKTSEDAFWD